MAQPAARQKAVKSIKAALAFVVTGGMASCVSCAATQGGDMLAAAERVALNAVTETPNCPDDAWVAIVERLERLAATEEDLQRAQQRAADLEADLDLQRAAVVSLRQDIEFQRGRADRAEAALEDIRERIAPREEE